LINADATKAEHYIARASNSLKLRRFQSAADDAEAAIALAPQNATAHFRKGCVVVSCFRFLQYRSRSHSRFSMRFVSSLSRSKDNVSYCTLNQPLNLRIAPSLPPPFGRLALFQLDQYAGAKQAFITAAAHGKQDTDLWIRKCDAELKDLNGDASAAASSSSSSSASASTTSASASAAVSVAPAATAAARTLADQMKPHSWLQSATHVNLTVWAKNVAADAIAVEFASAHDVDVRVAFPDGSHYRKRFELARAIVVAESSFRATAYKIEITLRKDDAAAAAADARPEWPALERTEAAAVAAAVSGAKHVAVPARASHILDFLHSVFDARNHSQSCSSLSCLTP
jgi:hypothetical protein